MTTVSEAMQVALAHLKAGELQNTEHICRQVLEVDPRHAPAVNLLGLVALQQGCFDVAAQRFGQAIDLGPALAIYHAHLGEAFRGLGRLDDAAASYGQALRIEPDWAEAINNRGTILQAQGRFPEAMACYQQALVLKPRYLDAHSNLGTVFQDQGQWDAAIRCHQLAVAIEPRFARGHYNLGVALTAQHRLDEAAIAFRNAIGSQSSYAEAHYGLATILQKRDQLDEAEAAYREALRLKPAMAEAHNGLGTLYLSQGRLAESTVCYQTAISIRPDYSDAYFNWGIVLEEQNQPGAAIDKYRQAIERRPDQAEAHYNLGRALRLLGQNDEAAVAYEEAVRHQPKYALAYNNLGNIYLSQGRGEEAVASHRRAVECDPANAWIHSNLLYTFHYLPHFDERSVFAEHRTWAERHAEPLTAQSRAQAAGIPDRSPDRRLRIGYVSANFYQHALNFFIEPVLRSHNHQRFEVFCYSDILVPDAVTLRLQVAADHWRDTRRMSDVELAQLVRDDGIDILVDLAGHIGGNRLLAFARKPAPIQVTYLGYQNTTGMSAMDYRFTDARADPPGLPDLFYSERLIRLPRSFFCYQPAAVAPPITALPALDAGHVTFGSFNNFGKVTPEVISTWLRILSRVPKSRLLVLAQRGYVERQLRERAMQQGIDPQRVEVCEQQPLDQYFRLLQRADIALDPFPFNGHTTTCDSIWMGVPVVMIEGQTYAARFGASVLANVGLTSLITANPIDYSEAAVSLAMNLKELAVLRSELRQRMADSALMDFEGFTRNVEAAYRQMWIEYINQDQ